MKSIRSILLFIATMLIGSSIIIGVSFVVNFFDYRSTEMLIEDYKDTKKLSAYQEGYRTGWNEFAKAIKCVKLEKEGHFPTIEDAVARGCFGLLLRMDSPYFSY